MAFLNTQYHQGSDPRANGDIERDIMALLKSGTNLYHLVETDDRWEVYYHLSPSRESLLSWYEFPKESSLLEIGAGAGALTGLLCDRCRRVVALEGSLERATIIHERHRKWENLEILVGHLDDIVFEEQFDYITLIGVLEYADTFIDSPDPQRDLLQRARGLLKPGGKMLLATPNRFGLKYWCGAAEDRQGVPFAGIQGYKSTDPGKTFDRKSLADLLQKAGFEQQKFYYPFPNHTLPRLVFTDEYPYDLSVHWKMIPFYLAKGIVVANELDLWKDIAANQVTSFFANSFLVEAGGCTIAHDEAIFASLDFYRQPAYSVHTVIKKNGTVEKCPSHPAAIGHLRALVTNTEQLAQRGIPVIPCQLVENTVVSKFSPKPRLLDTLVDLLRADRFPEAAHYLDRLREYIIRSSEHVDAELNFLYQTGSAPREMAFGPVLEQGYLDLAPQNCLLDGDDFVFFDQEWVLPNTPIDYILLQCVQVIGKALTLEERNHWTPKVLTHFGLYPEKVACMKRLRERFVNNSVQRGSEYFYHVQHSLLDASLHALQTENSKLAKRNEDLADRYHRNRTKLAAIKGAWSWRYVARPIQKVTHFLCHPYSEVRRVLERWKRYFE